jgi:hypothetical protein
MMSPGLGKKIGEKIAAVSADLRNPDMRVALSPDFPPVVSAIVPLIRLVGAALGAERRVFIAYPHKDPELFPKHRNRAESAARDLRDNLKGYMPNVEWELADALCETRSLERSRDQRMIRTLIARQAYRLNPALQARNPVSFTGPQGRAAAFILVDHAVEQGTTFADLRSCIAHNGGRVLCAFSDYPVHDREVHMAQAASEACGPFPALQGPFGDAARNTKGLPFLAREMSKSAGGGDWTPQRCIEAFEAALGRHGNSVFSLTNEECMRAADEDFHVLMKGLEKAKVQGPPVTPRPASSSASPR